MFKVILCLVLLSLILSVDSIFFPELLSASKQPFCSENLGAHGWLLLYYQEGVYIKPVQNSIRVAVSTSKTRIVLKFCEDKSQLELPRGDYCVFKGRSACPHYFEIVAITQQQPHSFEKSLNFGDMELCCSSYVSDPIAFPMLPPFALVKKGERCETLANTTVSEVSLKLFGSDVSVMDFCYYDTSPCSIHNGGCDQVCYHDNTAVTCSCYHGYSVINETSCQIDYQYGIAPSPANLVNSNQTSSVPLFSTSRDYVVMTISVAVVLLIVFVVIILLIRLNRIVCISNCYKAKRGSAAISSSLRKVAARRYSSEKEKPLQRSRVSTQNFNRDSISAPQVGVVAMDLLNRPKTHTSNMHDLPSNSNRVSYYENTDSGSIRTESIYDSLDRRPHNRVAMKTSVQSAQYDEPDKDQVVQPLMLSSNQTDSQYYCEPDLDDDVPETPLPAYSPGYNGPSGANGSITSEHSPFVYNVSQTYQDPNLSQTYQDPTAKFSHGTLGRKFRAPSVQEQADVTRAASIARIAPTPRITSHWDQSELLKPVSVGHLGLS